MAHARLHIICGNCGNKDMMTFKIDPQGHDITNVETEYEPSVSIYCGNCSTVHDLSNTVPMEKEK